MKNYLAFCCFVVLLHASPHAEENHALEFFNGMRPHIKGASGTDLIYTATPASGAKTAYILKIQYFNNTSCTPGLANLNIKGTTVLTFSLDAAHASHAWYLAGDGLSRYMNNITLNLGATKASTQSINLVDQNANVTGGCTTVSYDSDLDTFTSSGTPGTISFTATL
jgi:hypothetical protein